MTPVDGSLWGARRASQPYPASAVTVTHAIPTVAIIRICVHFPARNLRIDATHHSRVDELLS